MTSDQQIHDRLGSLPPLAPPVALGERIGRMHRARLHRLRVGAAALAVVVAGMAVLPLLPDDPAPASPAQVVTGGSPPDQDTLASVRALDRALQAAYARNASDEELAPLWTARRKLLAPVTTATDI